MNPGVHMWQDFKILIVDDDAVDSKLVRRLLVQAGSRSDAHAVTTVADALDFGAMQPDAVFLDHLLPGQSGLEALPALREKWPQAAFFLMTGRGGEDLAKSAIQAGATDYISKAVINPAALQRIVEKGVVSARLNWKLAQQQAELATFSDVLVHDLKAPIRAVDYLCQQVEEDLDAGDYDEVRGALALMRKSTRHMMNMLRSLADHIRMDRLEAFEEADPREIVETALAALEREIAESGAEVTVNIPPGLPPVRCGLPVITQVLQNLVANAIKYAGAAVPRLGISVTEMAGEMRFEVADNGIGIAPEHQALVFEPFRRVPGQAHVEGTGLGLATCRKQVLRHDGRIWCESAPGAGTKMVFCLPLTGQSRAPELRSA